MYTYQENFDKEKKYLDKIKDIIQRQMLKESDSLDQKKGRLIADRREMYENTTHYSQDFEKLSDAIQYLNPIEIQTYDYQATANRIRKYEKMQHSPYFARIDFIEEGFDEERIYIGMGNLADEKTHQTYICDWRAPISSIYYRYGLGRASYKAPYGNIEGEVTLKRQYEIKNGELEYFLDSDITITDAVLKQALSENSSPKMKSIVETIQKEQDAIIRDMDNDLLIVQGVAGSGKTSVALHRVAYLLYHGISEKLNSQNILLITPNELFEKYIENVLPELGEDNIQTLTMEELFSNVMENGVMTGTRNSVLEEIICSPKTAKRELLKSSMEFFMSKDFIIILNRFINYFEHKLIDFRDIFYNGECIANRQLVKAELLREKKAALPLEKRLAAVEKRIMLKVHESRKVRLEKLEKFIAQYPEHIYEIKPLARLLSLKETRVINREVSRFTRIDPLKLYKRLLCDEELFLKMSQGLILPENIHDILEHARVNLGMPVISYYNSMALLALKLKLSGCDLFKDIMQIVIDEAQDYYPLQYDILRMVYKNARYTIIGDINQTIEKRAHLSGYWEIKQLLDKKTSTAIIMNKSFRNSYEINRFCLNFFDSSVETEGFERHGSPPEIMGADNLIHMNQSVIEKVNRYRAEGFNSIAVICKSMADTVQLFNDIGGEIGAEMIRAECFTSTGRVIILPVYMAKGLEFDAVIVYDTSRERYSEPDDRQLLYICCTRALHRLALVYTGQKSDFLPHNL